MPAISKIIQTKTKTCLLRSNSHTTKFNILNYTIQSILVDSLVSEYFYHPSQRNLVLFSYITLFPQPQTASNLLSIFMDSPFLSTERILSHVNYQKVHYVLKAHTCLIKFFTEDNFDSLIFTWGSNVSQQRKNSHVSLKQYHGLK